MPIEIEAKIKIDDRAVVVGTLKTKGAKLLGEFEEENTFFDTPDNKLVLANKGLRIRTNKNLQANQTTFIITFKGPQKSGQVKQREEIETTVDNFQSAVSLLEQLGFLPTLSFEKRRQSWKLGECKIELDEVPILGSYVEIEGPSEETVMQMRDLLELADRPLVRTSYIAMLAEHLKKTGSKSKDIRFASRD